jgi:hypothetical protein
MKIPMARRYESMPRSASGGAVPSAGVRWRSRLRRHLGWVIAVKVALITLLFVLFFSAAHRPRIDPAGVSDHLQLER